MALRNWRHERFCRLFVLGNPDYDPRLPDQDQPVEGAVDTVHNGKASYELAGYKSRGNAAAVGAHRLVQREDIRTRIAELREEAVQDANIRRFSWAQLMPYAQALFFDVLRGRRSASAIEMRAAERTVERVEGPLAHRFRDPKTGEEKFGIPVYVYGGDEPGAPEPTEDPDDEEDAA